MLIDNSHNILVLDASGHPHNWIKAKDAAFHYVKDHIAYEVGDHFITLKGGTQRLSGERSILKVNSIIALRDARYVNRIPEVTRDSLFMRDRYCCAYCSERFRKQELEAEHIIPESRGGEWSWMNLVSACRACNNRKKARTPDEAGMPLMYIPYTPNIFESFIMQGRNVLADQMQYLLAGVPSKSRLI